MHKVSTNLFTTDLETDTENVREYKLFSQRPSKSTMQDFVGNRDE